MVREAVWQIAIQLEHEIHHSSADLASCNLRGRGASGIQPRLDISASILPIFKDSDIASLLGGLQAG